MSTKEELEAQQKALLESLPPGHTIVYLHDPKLSPEQQKEYLKQIYQLLEENYGSYAESENMDRWFKELYSKDSKELTNRAIPMIIGPDGKVAAVTTVELYRGPDEKAALAGYALGKPKSQGDYYPIYIELTKVSGQLAVGEITQTDKVPINILAGEHKFKHVEKQQASLNSGLLPFFENAIVIYPADKIEGKPLQATIDEGATNRANIFISTFGCSEPQALVSESLRGLGRGYSRTNGLLHSIGQTPENPRGREAEDPAVQGYMAMADHLDDICPGLTNEEFGRLLAGDKFGDKPEYKTIVDEFANYRSQFDQKHLEATQKRQNPGQTNPEATRIALFNREADPEIHKRAKEAFENIKPGDLPHRLQEFYGYAQQDRDQVAKKIGQMELSDYFLNKPGRTPEEITTGLALQQAAADDSDAPGVFGNLLAKRQMAEDLETGNNGVTQDKFRALQIYESILIEADLRERFNSYAPNDRVMQTIVEKRDALRADPELQYFADDILQNAKDTVSVSLIAR